MKTSRYLNETLFYNPSPATDQFFEEKSVKLFEPHDENSYLDIYVQPKPEDVSEDESRPNEMVWTPHPRKGLESSCSSPREPKLGIDQTHYLLRNLPIYDESPGLERMLTVSDPKVLSRIVQVRTDTLMKRIRLIGLERSRHLNADFESGIRPPWLLSLI